eukprot:TRINITY_DN29078_c0_g1_i3.p1 TRINITY_DN29078_c0_g1~~TRINITY_DN29078_c0_g1_i3.p1  ORF type:complete len:553 (+),score=157.15 TRINITY_DN29078_c0_g1_i3:79-1737(+)
MIRRPPRSTLSSSSAASDVYKRQVSGRVQHASPSAGGVAGVQITVDGQHKATTDSLGAFTLEHLTAGVYDVQASKRHHTFRQLPTQLTISPSTASLDTIFVSRYDLCGNVELEEEEEVLGKRRIQIHLLQDGTRIDSIETGDQFCFKVIPGTYQVAPVVSHENKKPQLVLAPENSGDLVVEEAPILNVTFSKARVHVTGMVECIESPCDPSISVTLTLESGERHTVHVTSGPDGSSVFEFGSVVPGTHKVSVNQDAWCWEQQIVVVPIDLSTKPVSGIVFKQSGYILNAILSHDIDLVFSLEKPKNSGAAAEHTFKMARGSQNFCLSKPGVYKITPRSCYIFEKDVYQYDTSAPRVLDFEATHYKVTGVVETDQEVPSPIHLHVSHLKSSSTPNQPQTVIQAELSSHFNTTNGVKFIYSYTYWARLGESIELTPVSINSLMFYPKSRTASVVRNECPPPVGAIQARTGLQVNGEVRPPLGGVTITVLDQVSSTVMTSVMTSSDGRYTAGPLYDNQSYKLMAHKHGFNFKHEGGGVFRAIELSQIAILSLIHI